VVAASRSPASWPEIQATSSNRHFVVDFINADAKLILEIDGGQHGQRAEADKHRTAVLEFLGYLVLRFWNNECLQILMVCWS
jgi:very-short-patch-repair endonuclease